MKEKELTKNQIEEAIKKKWCPFCQEQDFSCEEQAFQRLCFDVNLEPDWLEIEAGDKIDNVICRNCCKIIPTQIWKKWDIG